MTTIEQLSALSDEEIVERLAVEVMGWRKEKAEQCSCMEWHHGEGWYTYLYSIGGGCPRCAGTSDWRPLDDWNHTMQVAGKMKLFLLAKVQTGTWRCGYRDGPVMPFYVENTDPQRAICLAALASVSA